MVRDVVLIDEAEEVYVGDGSLADVGLERSAQLAVAHEDERRSGPMLHPLEGAQQCKRVFARDELRRKEDGHDVVPDSVARSEGRAGAWSECGRPHETVVVDRPWQQKER